MIIVGQLAFCCQIICIIITHCIMYDENKFYPHFKRLLMITLVYVLVW